MIILFSLSFSPLVMSKPDIPEFVRGVVKLTAFLNTSHIMNTSLAVIDVLSDKYCKGRLLGKYMLCNSLYNNKQ
jgi:hypothetical protein